jgi:hypothetical protein
MEVLAGLIQTLLLKGDYVRAVSETEQIIAYLQSGNTLDGVEAPLRVYYACYLALEKTGDPRSQTWLHAAAQLLETQVSKLQDEEARRIFIENVSWRHALQQAWRKKTD